MSSPAVNSPDWLGLPGKAVSGAPVNMIQSEVHVISYAALPLAMANADVLIRLQDCDSLALGVRGEWRGTLVFESSMTGDVWYECRAVRVGDGVICRNTSHNGDWRISCSLLLFLRVRVLRPGTGMAQLSITPLESHRSMTQNEWLGGGDPAAMFLSLRGEWSQPRHERAAFANRKLALFACACARTPGAFERPLTHQDLRAISVVETHADDETLGLTDQGESLAKVREMVRCEGVDVLFRGNGWQAAWHWVQYAGRSKEFQRLQCALLREVVGPLPDGSRALQVGPRASDSRWQRMLLWENGLIPQTARRMQHSGDFTETAVLADMLLDAGIDDEDLLEHLRGRERCPRWKTVQSGQNCPSCGKGGAWRSGGPGFESEKICYACDYFTWTPGETVEVPCLECKGGGWRALQAPHVKGCWAVDLLAEGQREGGARGRMER